MTEADLHERGERMFHFIEKVFKYPRSITGDGVRQTLQEIGNYSGGLNIHEIASGTPVGDWVVPDEWNLKRARLIDPTGRVVCDTINNNLHLVGYSIPYKAQLQLDELQDHLFSLPNLPEAIPYVTSYYEPRWGFCLSHNERTALVAGTYEVDIETTLEPGSLTYGDLVLAGESTTEILLTTYVCHPSMANNELSGPAVLCEIINYLKSMNSRRYTYRFVFAPETIGAITYISQKLQHLRTNVQCGLVVTCVGDDRSYSLLPSRDGNHKLDHIARHVLRHATDNFVEYPWSSRGSDERQYSAPGIDIPMVSIMRTKYWEYPEYHTSLDDLTNVVSVEGLTGGFNVIRQAIDILEGDKIPRANFIGEPMLGRRGLYSTVGGSRYAATPQALLDVYSYSDGSRSIFDIAEVMNQPFGTVLSAVLTLVEHGIVNVVDSTPS